MFNRSLFFVCYASDIMASKDSLSPLHTLYLSLSHTSLYFALTHSLSLYVKNILVKNHFESSSHVPGFTSG